MSAPKILLVDDETNALNALQRLLSGENFEITATDSPFQALHLASKEEFTIILSDYRMPHMEGTMLLQKVKEISPASMRILLTGHADMETAIAAINEGEVDRFLLKPWDDTEMIRILKLSVEHFEVIKDQKTVYGQNSDLKKKNQSLVEKNIEQAFQNKRLCHALDQSYIISINALAKSIKLYESHLWHHSLAVKMICQKIAKLLGLPPQKSTQLAVAAILHDIGKIGLPHTVLLKPEKMLSPSEKELYQRHPLNGYDIVSQIPYFQEAAVFIRHHHECFDGTGYPEGLKGTDIPAGARIIAVANTYAKIKKGHPFSLDASYQEAMTFLEGQGGTRFDPDAISLLKECIAVSTGQKRNPARQETIDYWQHVVVSEPEKVAMLAAISESADGTPDLSNMKLHSLDDREQLLINQPDAVFSDLKPLDIKPYLDSADSTFIWEKDARSSKFLTPSDNPIGKVRTESLTSTDELIDDWSLPEILDWQVESSLMTEVPEYPSETRLEVISKFPESEVSGYEPEQMISPDHSQAAKKVLDAIMELPASEVSCIEPEPLITSMQSKKNTLGVPETEVKSSGQSVLNGQNPANSLTDFHLHKARNQPGYRDAYRRAKQKYKEVVIPAMYLRVGMVLSRDIMTYQGVKLLQKGTTIGSDQLDGIKSYLKRNNLQELEIYILSYAG